MSKSGGGGGGGGQLPPDLLLYTTADTGRLTTVLFHSYDPLGGVIIGLS